MIRLVCPVLAFSLLAGCATNDTQYQISPTGGRQTKIEAERAYAGRSPLTGPTENFSAAPRVLSSHFPDYPRGLRNAGIEGRVVVLFIVEADGSVSDPAVQGSPPPELAALALDAMMQWKFGPATKDGVPIRARLQQTFVFKTE